VDVSGAYVTPSARKALVSFATVHVTSCLVVRSVIVNFSFFPVFEVLIPSHVLMN
jgi:hypothetical protein